MASLPWSRVDAKELSGIRGVAFDIDDTFSSDGLLSAEAFSALWSLKRAGFFLVPITGRPAGWCDHFARFWPVDAVVCENGAFTFFMREERDANGVVKTTRHRYDTPGGDPDRAVKLLHLRATLAREFPGLSYASDQLYRENDLAIDFCEDVAPWSRAEVDRLVAVCEREGAHAKVSSIHVNTWYGEFDKRAGFQAWCDFGAPGLGRKFPASFGVSVTRAGSETAGTSASAAASSEATAPPLSEWIFAGDSPNDEPMFKYFPTSVGVANLANFLDRLKKPPTYITARPSGQGFVEMATKLLESRK